MRNATYEQALQKSGIGFEYLDKVPLESIDASKSLRNQARLVDTLDPELVNAYAQSDKEGFEFPPLVAWRPGKGKWNLIDGNHRLAAKQKNNRKTVDIYAVNSTDPKVIDRITWTFNNLVNGRRLSSQEALEHAISFVRKYGITYAEAAKEWGVNVTTLNARIRVEEAKEVLRKNNVRITPALTDDHIKTLSPLITVGEDLFCKAAEVVTTSGINTSETDEFYRDIKRATTTDTKAKIIQEYAASDKVAERKAETKGGKTRVRANAPRERFCRGLKELRNVMEDFDPKAIQPTNSEWKQYREAALSIAQKLTRMFGFGIIPQGDNTEVG
jgi:hypothetical protein